MIRAEVRDVDDTLLVTVYVETAPRVGEFLWFALDRDKAAVGSPSVEVTEVCHRVSTLVPRKDDEVMQSLCLYVKPVL